MTTAVILGALLNLVGLSTGVVLYAMLLLMVLRAGRAPRRIDLLLLATSILGLVWNVCALPVYVLRGVGAAFPVAAALGFSALGLLPAVVVHSVLRGERDGIQGWPKRTIAALAYALSGTAALLQLSATATGAAVPVPAAMRLLTYGFVALGVPLAVVTRGQPGSRRTLWVIALAIFAVSALHLSALHHGGATWPVELLGHHASLPLALAILYQDYPFALADLFLKRALVLLGLVVIAFAAIAAFGAGSTAFATFLQADPAQVGALVTVWVATALAYPLLSRFTGWFVDAVVLHRPDYPSLRAALGRVVQQAPDAAAALSAACQALVPALSSQWVMWVPWTPSDARGHVGPAVVTGPPAYALWSTASAFESASGTVIARTPVLATVTVPTSEPPLYVIGVGALTGGRRFLSDDVATLEAIAVTVARRIDAIRFTQERYERELREREIGKLASEAELRALRAQINPHFLFNALTTIGYLIEAAPTRALRTLLRLTSLLRGVLRSDGEYTTLGRELELIEAYLEIERARFEERLRVTIDVPPRIRGLRIPPLILQPLVENAVKHGIAATQQGGEVIVRAAVVRREAGNDVLQVTIHDTGAGTSLAMLTRRREAGVGLRNVERRLVTLYGRSASLTVHTSPGAGTTVDVCVPVTAAIAVHPGPVEVAR